jgi:hypothetical protein
VTPSLHPAARSQTGLIRDQVYERIRQLEQQEEQQNQTITAGSHRTAVHPWLERTRWQDYTQGYTFTELAALAYMPDPEQEPLLQLWIESLDTILDQANESISTHRINMFDQARINSFIHDAYRRPSHRPVFYHLQPATTKRYRRIWKRFLCFIYRTTQPGQSIQLAHRLAGLQADLLFQMKQLSGQLYEQTVLNPSDPSASRDTRSLRKLHRICLLFCIALLDHILQSDVFESVVVGFFAILGIDAAKETFRGPYLYTPILSGFIKIGQLLVIQRSVLAVEEGSVDEPSTILNEMRQRFLIHGCATPVGWALRLRTYGKKIRMRQTPIPLGQVAWSDDNTMLSYKGQSLHMADFKDFVHDQVDRLQTQVDNLLLQSPSSSPPSVPKLELSHIYDDHAHLAKGWNFLLDPRNQTQFAGSQRWILDRVIQEPHLRRRFLDIRPESQQFAWKQEAAKDYLVQIDQFLERLLLVCHFTAGGTELLSLRHINTIHGQHRNIFIENGLVGLVTAYHKGYHMTGSTSLIHRYLPEQVSQILVYYLWLVHPFQRQLRGLAFQETMSSSPFLWPSVTGGFSSERLSKTLRREFQENLRVDITLADYRHVANAISRRHLRVRGFQREYEIPVHPADIQAARTSWTSSMIYARPQNHAPGHLEARRWEYRVISRGWHHLLGFTDLVTKRTPADLDLDDVGDSSVARKRRKHTHLDGVAGKNFQRLEAFWNP